LFESLVSVRDKVAPRAPGTAPHLGLGLFIVRLVVELHRGVARASNLAGGDGVEFTLALRGMPRRRL
jgi:signal transduction histidine kinase